MLVRHELRRPSIFKPGKPGNRGNRVTMRVCGLPVLIFRGFAKPGNRENRTESDPAGILPQGCRDVSPGFFARSFPPAGPTNPAIYPREVVKRALALNAGAVILAHNHPSGAEEPSQADRWITDQLKTALAMVDVRTLDHFVIAGRRYTSFMERGWLPESPAESMLESAKAKRPRTCKATKRTADK